MPRVLAAIVAALFFACAASAPVPTREKPALGCAISCKNGWLSRPQKLCRGTRWFQDVVIVGEYVTRGADGSILQNLWVTKSGDFPKDEVEFGSCSSVISRIVQMREPESRGRHPGERFPWDPPKP